MNSRYTATRALLALAAAAALQSCASGVSTLAPQSASALNPLANRPSAVSLRAKRAPEAWLSPQALGHKHVVYIAGQGAYDNGFVDIFAPKGQSPIGEITSGISTPEGIATDAAGNLYVANSGNNTVTVYAPGTLTPSLTYSSGVNVPYGVGVGADGTVYVANVTGSGSGAGTVTEYPSGSTVPSQTLTLPGMAAVNVALDAPGNLYVSWYSLTSAYIQIEKYAPRSSTGTNLRLDLPAGSFPAYALAFDRDGNLALAYEPLTHAEPKYLGIFPPGATEPVRKIDESSLLDIVDGIAFPRDGDRFYVASTNCQLLMQLDYRRLMVRSVASVGGATGLALSPGT
jgi:hypothetical protein